MASISGNFNTNTYEDRYYTFSWTASQSVANNTSTISWTLSAGGFSSWVAERTLTLVVAGETVYSKSARVERYPGVIATGTKVITHDSAGNASFSASIQAAVYTSSITCSGSGSFDLTTIPRKSTLSVANGTLGSAQTLTISEKASAFSHKLTYSCGSASGYILGSSSATSTALSTSWTAPKSLANQNTSGTSVSITFTLSTYNGSTLIGSNTYTKSFAIPTTSEFSPTCSISVSDASGNLSKYGNYIKGLSKFKVTVTGTGAYGSTISSYKTSANGSSYTTASFTTDALKTDGTLKISTTVTDSRGRTATASTNISVIDYHSPNVSRVSVLRCDSAGNEQDNGNYVLVSFDASISPLNDKNSATYYLDYKMNTENSYDDEPEEIILTDYNNIYAVNDGFTIIEASADYSYNVRIRAVDDFGSVYSETNVSTGATILNIHESGNAVSIGKVAELNDDETNKFEVAWPTYIHKDLRVNEKTTTGTLEVLGDTELQNLVANICNLGQTTINSGSYIPVILQRDSTTYSPLLAFDNTSGRIASIGFGGSNKHLSIYNPDASSYATILDGQNYNNYAAQKIIVGGNITSGYIRFPDVKKQITWKNASGTAGIATAWGTCYEFHDGSGINLGNWAAAFSDTPTASYNVKCDSQNAGAWLATYQRVSKTHAGICTIVRPNALTTSLKWTISAIAVGPYT